MIILDFPNAVNSIERFYGRGNELRLALSTLVESTRVPVVIIGERRIGKTSFQNVTIEQIDTLYPQKLVPLTIEPRGIQTVDQFVAALLTRLSTWTGRELKESGLKGSDGHIHLENPSLIESAFERLLAGSQQRFLLGVDEFDELIRVTGEIGEQEQQRLMGLIHHLVENSRLPVSLFLSMTRLPDTYGNEVASPLLAKAQVIELRPFEPHEIETMLNGLLNREATFELEAIDWLYRYGGGHPYITKLILANLFQRYVPGIKPLTITCAMLDDALIESIDDPRGNYALENIYRVHFNADEKRVLLYLTERGEPVDIAELRSASISSLTAARNLEKRHYLVEQDGTYILRAQFLARWLENWAEFDEEIERLNVHRMVN